MGGPMAYLAPGNRSHTAWAITWAVEWRRTYRPASESAVTMATSAPSGRGAFKSDCAPSTTAASAALRSRGPIEAARSAGVEPAGRRRLDPSGRRTSMSVGIPGGYRRLRCPLRGILRAMGYRFEYRDVRVDGDDGPIVEGFSARIPT